MRFRLRALSVITVVVAILLFVLPAIELACDGQFGGGHEYGHGHASPAILGGVPALPMLGFGGDAPALTRIERAFAVRPSVFVPPRA